MQIKKVTFKILRYKPGYIDPPRFQGYTLEVDPQMSVLDGLERIRLQQDNTLMFRHSCHHSSCGTCACKIEGKERLTCITAIQDLKSDVITLTPLDGFKPLGDLVVDTTSFFENFGEKWSYLRKSEKTKSTRFPSGIEYFQRFENCIECGACISGCPITLKNKGFLGPAVLASVNNELKKSPQKTEDLLLLAGGRRGEHLCERALNCSRVCPTGVYPARHIAELRGLLEKKQISQGTTNV
jgi:succinate dehydrogenase / fumarate reductase iron-sulfur subunit